MAELLDGVPGEQEYRTLRVAAGMAPRSDAAARAGLPNSLFSVVLRADGRLVGMGRVVGDGGNFAQIVDIAVHPDWQGKGHGKAIFARLLDWCKVNLPSTCYLSLIADPPADKLYAKFGFDYAIGMGMKLP